VEARKLRRAMPPGVAVPVRGSGESVMGWCLYVRSDMTRKCRRKGRVPR
jgi:hypothetical protein